MNFSDLQKKAQEIRVNVVKMISRAKSGHPAGALGMADVFTALYFAILKHNPQIPDWNERDRVIVSNGHIAPLLYAVLSTAGYFPKDELESLRKLGSRLQGHPERERKLPGIESTSGPLGEGLAQAAGYALAARIDGKSFNVFCILSDGEHDEGNHWEAVNFASKYAISKLIAIVDRNGIQLSGKTEDIMPIEPLMQKYLSFGWNVLEIDGHDFGEIVGAVDKARLEKEKPTVIIANTTPGKGVSFMEGKWEWHGKAPDENETKIALEELANEK